MSYFQNLNEVGEYYDNKDFEADDVCCGKIKRGSCHRSGTMVNFDTKEVVNKDDVLYCRSGNCFL